MDKQCTVTDISSDTKANPCCGFLCQYWRFYAVTEVYLPVRLM